MRPGYGYYNIPEVTRGIALPDSTAIWKVNIENGVVQPLLKYTVFANFHHRTEMKNTRCDLHHRWNQLGNKICFDGVFERQRRLYYVDLEEE